jgi:transposase InsO family protein
MQHPNARLTPRGRRELVRLVEQGSTLREAASACGVAASTACVWARRWRTAALADQTSLACLNDRSSRPAGSPRRCSLELEERLCAARRETGWGPRLIAGVTGVPHQTVWKVLQRGGCSRRPKPTREAVNRYEWPCPGDLLHMDTKRYARFTRPGHAVTGDRSSSGAEKREQVGTEFAHAIIDDHTRLAYSELHPDEIAGTVVAFTQRALAWYAQHGITPKRVMTDNAWTYTHSQRLKELLAANDVTHLTITPRRPQTNGKIERFHQTMAREWGYGLTYRSSAHHAEALPHWLNHYNEHRPHSAIGNRPPISRVRNV